MRLVARFEARFPDHISSAVARNIAATESLCIDLADASQEMSGTFFTHVEPARRDIRDDPG